MSQLGTLHHFPRAQADRSISPDELRSAEPLDVPASQPDMAEIGGGESLRLGAALTIRSRWPLMAIISVISLVVAQGLTDTADWVQQSAHGVLMLMVAAFGLIRGLDGQGPTLAFWRGLGVRPASFELGVVGVDLLFMGALLFFASRVTDAPVLTLLGAGLALVAYGFGSATRGAASSEGGRAALVMAMVSVMLTGTALSFLASYGHVVLALLMQMGIIGAAGVLSRVLLSDWAPQTAAVRQQRRGHAVWLGCALSGLLVIPVQFFDGMPESTAAVPDAAGLFVPDRDPMSGKQLWRVGADGEPERLSLRGRVLFPEPGPHRSAAFFHKDLGAVASMLVREDQGREQSRGSLTVRDGVHFAMITAGGEAITCDGPLLSGSTAFDADGMGATRTLSSGEVWRLDGDGCRLRVEEGDP